MKRVLDCHAADFRHMDGQALKQAIRASEGRGIVSETMAGVSPLYPGVSNAELAAAFGSDLLLINLFDVENPGIQGCHVDDPADSVRHLKRLVGRPFGLNLEPVDGDADALEALDHLPAGRIASRAALAKAQALGFDFVCLTGNPKSGVSNGAILRAIARAREVFGDNGLIIAGKMHGAGVAGESGGGIIDAASAEAFVRAGADIVLLPAPGTIPGMTVERAGALVERIHALGALAMLAIGTSQEGADENTIRQIALNSKMAGADLHHIGDTGYYGIAVPENIMAYSIAVRGRRHTYVRMAVSINR